MNDAIWLPADDGLLAATEDPWASIESTGLAHDQDGMILLSRLMVRADIPQTRGLTVLYEPGSSGGQDVFFALVNAAGTIVTQTATLAALLAAADASGVSPVPAPWLSSPGLPAGMYWGALLQGPTAGTKSPAWWGSGLNNGSALSPASNPATARAGFVGTAEATYPTFPVSFSPGADIYIPPDGNALSATPFWFGIW